jgi:surfeit locus 1 family protein
VLSLLFSRKWWWTTLLVIAAVGVMIRLGMWQIDRHTQRQAFNTRVSAQLAQPPLVLEGAALKTDLRGMEYRSVIVRGAYDHAGAVALRNQVSQGRPGVHLLTPLVIAGSEQAVLVDRGWIPAEASTPDQRSRFDEPGPVEVRGVIRASRSRPDFGGVPDPPPTPGERLLTWNNVNVERIQQQVSSPLLPIYIQQAPDPAWTGMPARSTPELDLSEGSHLGYAAQWFLFAAVLGVGYPYYLRQQARTDMGRR